MNSGPRSSIWSDKEFVKDGQNYFAFEGSDGIADLKSSGDILKANARSSAGIPERLPGQESLRSVKPWNRAGKAGLPLAVSWPGSIADAESAVRAFYGELAYGNALESAMTSMRHEIGAVSQTEGDLVRLSFTLFP